MTEQELDRVENLEKCILKLINILSMYVPDEELEVLSSDFYTAATNKGNGCIFNDFEY